MGIFTRSKLAAGLQEIVSRRREESGLYAEVVSLLMLPPTGCLLEVGCGSGLQLKVAHRSHPELGLYGLDISSAAIHNAQRNLASIEVDLRCGTIEKTNYEDDFFDVVTCLASMSYWDHPSVCYDEIHRILKPGGVAKLVEPQKDIDLDEVVRTIKANLADTNPIRRFLAANLNKFGLKYGRKLGLRLYSTNEIREIARTTQFGESIEIQQVALQNLPIFMLISMHKLANRSF